MFSKELSSIKRYVNFAILGLLFLVAVLLMPGIGPIRGKWANAAWNFIHVPGFFLVMWFCYIVMPRRLRSRSRIAFAGIMAFGIGIATEAIQTLVGRSGSIEDVVLNLAGILIAFGWLCRDLQWCRRDWVGIAVTFGVFAIFYFFIVGIAKT